MNESGLAGQVKLARQSMQVQKNAMRILRVKLLNWKALLIEIRECVDEVSMLKNDNWLLNGTDLDLKDIFWISSFGGLNNFQTSKSYGHISMICLMLILLSPRLQKTCLWTEINMYCGKNNFNRLDSGRPSLQKKLHHSACRIRIGKAKSDAVSPHIGKLWFRKMDPTTLHNIDNLYKMARFLILQKLRIAPVHSGNIKGLFLVGYSKLNPQIRTFLFVSELIILVQHLFVQETTRKHASLGKVSQSPSAILSCLHHRLRISLNT